MCRILLCILTLFTGAFSNAGNTNSSGESFACTAGNIEYDGQYVYQYDGFNRLVQVNHGGTSVFGADGRPIGGQLGSFVLRYVHDGLGRIIRKDQPDVMPSGGTYVPVRSNDYYYDGVRRIADVVRVPLVAEEPPPCDEFLAVTRSPGTSGEWIRSDGLSIGVELEPCQPTMGPPSGGGGGPTPGDPGHPDPGPEFEQWTNREYVYDPSGDLGGVDQFILQVSRDGTPVYMHQNVSLDVVALTAVDGNGNVIPIRQDIFSPYGEIAASDLFQFNDFNNPVGFKGLFFDRFADGPYESNLVPGHNPGVYQNRNRSYSPTLGRFLQRDPNGTGTLIVEAGNVIGQTIETLLRDFDVVSLYGDGLNLYQYVRSNPVMNNDPFGTVIPVLAVGGAIIGGTVIGGLIGGIIASYNSGSFWDGFKSGAVDGSVGTSLAAGTAFAASAIGLAAGIGLSYGGAAGTMAVVARHGGSTGEQFAAAAFGAIASAATDGMLSLLGGWFGASARAGITVTDRGLAHVRKCASLTSHFPNDRSVLCSRKGLGFP